MERLCYRVTGSTRFDFVDVLVFARQLQRHQRTWEGWAEGWAYPAQSDLSDLDGARWSYDSGKKRALAVESRALGQL